MATACGDDGWTLVPAVCDEEVPRPVIGFKAPLNLRHCSLRPHCDFVVVRVDCVIGFTCTRKLDSITAFSCQKRTFTQAEHDTQIVNLFERRKYADELNYMFVVSRDGSCLEGPFFITHDEGLLRRWVLNKFAHELLAKVNQLYAAADSED